MRCLLTILPCTCRPEKAYEPDKELWKGLAFILKNPDAAENIFNALFHVDWFGVLVSFTDDVSLFLGGSAAQI